MAGYDCDVAIVGYGPSGVSAANFLGAYGVSAIAFERDRDIYLRARAVTVNDWTLRCYQAVGLDQTLLATMDRSSALRWRTYAGKELMRVVLQDSTLGQPPSSMIYQPVMEGLLRQGAERFADRVSVRYGQEVSSVTQDADGVSVTSQDITSGAISSIRARYLLACDGGGSTVRSQLGIRLLGSTVDTKWVVIDARVKRWWPERHLLTFWSDRKRPVVDIPLAQGNHRWEFPLDPDESEVDFATHEQLWRRLSTMGITPEHVDLHQHAFYKHHVRNAERWRSGRMFLVGDAAHLMPPWAGSGMQSGIRDAFNLSWKLREVLAGRLPESLLDSDEPERAPNVALTTRMSEQMGRVIRMQMRPPEKLQALIGMIFFKLGMKLPPSPLGVPPHVESGWIRGPVGKTSPVGRMIPQPKIANATGRHMWLDEALGSGFALLADGVDPASLLTSAERTGWDRLNARYVAVRSGFDAAQADSDLFDLDGSLVAWMRKHRTRAIALRPDRFVAAAQGSGLAVPGT